VAGADDRTDRHLGGLVRAVARAHGQRPFVTFTDGATGERTELGCATFENWAAKAANLLVEDLGLAPGDVLGVDLGSHWTTMVIHAAAWRAGVVLALPGAWADAAAFAVREGSELCDEAATGPRLVVGAGFGGRLTGPAGEAIPFGEEVLGFPDDFDDVVAGADAPALRVAPGDDRSHAALLGAAVDLAAEVGLRPGDRWASTVAAEDAEGLVAGLVLALGLGGGLVLVRSTEPDDLAALAGSERCSAVLARDGDGAVGVLRR
jgi:uncharacterized protein (TIGR03089 family)